MLVPVGFLSLVLKISIFHKENFSKITLVQSSMICFMNTDEEHLPERWNTRDGPWLIIRLIVQFIRLITPGETHGPNLKQLYFATH